MLAGATRGLKRRLALLPAAVPLVSGILAPSAALVPYPARWLSAASPSSGPSSSPSAAATSSLRGPRDVPAATEQRVAELFHNPSIRLTRRQKQIFSRVADEPELPAIAESGYQYGLTAEDLEGRSEAVKRALSTRTADIAAQRAFHTAQIVKRYGTAELDTGSSRVQRESRRR
jgi:hypothetical protein